MQTGQQLLRLLSNTIIFARCLAPFFFIPTFLTPDVKSSPERETHSLYSNIDFPYYCLDINLRLTLLMVASIPAQKIWNQAIFPVKLCSGRMHWRYDESWSH